MSSNERPPKAAVASKSSTDPNYGVPVAGSKTEARGKQAHQRISKEIIELCAVIEDNGMRIDDDEEKNLQRTNITFGRLFQIYTVISNKVVGVLLRARKYGFVTFEGETLFQGRDDNVVITLLFPTSKVKEIAKENTVNGLMKHSSLQDMGKSFTSI